MHKWRKAVAWWLLVLLFRVLLPEAAMLRLHAHQHTADKPATSRTIRMGTKAVFSAKHQHCHVEQLYNAPFQPAAPVLLPAPVCLLRYATYQPLAPVWRASHLLDGASLRGPPTSRA